MSVASSQPRCIPPTVLTFAALPYQLYLIEQHIGSASLNVCNDACLLFCFFVETCIEVAVTAVGKLQCVVCLAIPL